MLSKLLLSSFASASDSVAEFCAAHVDHHGCCQACGYEAVKAGDDWLCMPGKQTMDFPFQLVKEDRSEYCNLIGINQGCSDICGYKWDASAGECRTVLSEPIAAKKAEKLSADPIIGGSGDFKYQYMPDLLKAPAGASLTNCHGLVTDDKNNIYLTYQNDGKDQNCLIKWNPDGTGGVFMSGGNSTLCSGTPHGLKIKSEENKLYLYHANNNQKLTKTTLDGSIVWQVNGNFGQDPKAAYRPTWFATPPNSDYMYLCDGYGSNNVYSFNKDGKFQGHTWGGRSPTKGPNVPHGKFSTNHGCTYEPREGYGDNMIVVSDRANSRLDYFETDPATGAKFEYANKTFNLQPALGTQTLPCNVRMYPAQEGRAIVPDLSGPVAVLDKNNAVISIVNVSVLLAAEQHKHPHDAIFLPNGDMVVATWAPGRISYWKKL